MLYVVESTLFFLSILFNIYSFPFYKAPFYPYLYLLIHLHQISNIYHMYIYMGVYRFRPLIARIPAQVVSGAYSGF